MNFFHELRIGNFILAQVWDYAQNKRHSADKGDFDRWVEIDSLLPYGDDYYINPTISEGEIESDYKSSTAKGITLTEEWLMKFGLEKSKYPRFGSESYSFLSGDLIWNIDESRWDYEVDTSPEGACEIVVASVASVHKLQNLYFVLTGEELVLKEEFKKTISL